MTKLFALDSMAILYRNYFAMIRSPMYNSRGLNTSGIYGFFSQVFKIIETEKPDYLAAVSDSKEPTFRHKQFPEYKANREKMPDDLVEQLPYLPRLADALNIPYIVMPGFEADDIIGTLMRICTENQIEGVMVTSDKDYMQLVTENNVMYNHKNQKIGIKQVAEKFDCRPDQVIEILGLMGDASDNIPGIKGVGEKTAIKLINQFGSIPNIYENLDQLPKNKLLEKLIKDKENALLSRELVTIDINVPLNFKLEDLNLKNANLHNNPTLIELLEELEFKSFLKKYKVAKTATGKKEAAEIKPETSELPAPKFISIEAGVIDSMYEFQELLKRLSNQKSFAFDLITGTESFINGRITGLVFAAEQNKSWYLNLENETFLAKRSSIFQELKLLIESAAIIKTVYNWKHILELLWTQGIKGGNSIFDVMLAAHLVESDVRDFSLEAISLRQCNFEKKYFIPFKKKKPGEEQVVLESSQDYYQSYCESACFIESLHQPLYSRLVETDTLNTYRFIEIRLAEVLAHMEINGVSINESALMEISDDFSNRLAELSQTIYKQAEAEFNINSVVELQSILYDKLKIHEVCKVKPKKIKLGNKMSTDEETLEKMSVHPLPKIILQYRELNKLKNTYVDQLPTYINDKTGKIHSSFRQAVAATGRLASDNPNLQNIPIRSEDGRKIRSAFVPSEPNHVLVSADYSQIELRVVAHFSKDPTFIKAYQENLDIHAITAATIFDVEVQDVTREMRSKAKEVNFGLIYRMGPERLAMITQTTKSEAKSFIEKYFNKYSTIHGLQEQFLAEAKEKGYARTLLGRKRYLPGIYSRGMHRRVAEGAAINTPIQGSAAEIIKLAMVNIDQKLKASDLKTRMILSVHDELVFDTPRKEEKEIVELVKKEMEQVVLLEVPLVAEVGVGNNWLEAH